MEDCDFMAPEFFEDAVKNAEPNWDTFRGSTRMKDLIQKCLSKDPN